VWYIEFASKERPYLLSVQMIAGILVAVF
jgi:hypothetical protein